MQHADLYSPEGPSNRAGTDIAVAIVTGLLAALALGQQVEGAGAWLSAAAAAIFGYLVSYWIRHQLLLPKEKGTNDSPQAEALAEAILDAKEASYAISSNWIDLWRTDAFVYYLSLDQVASLTNYTALSHSPLRGFDQSDDAIKKYIRSSEHMMAEIAEGRPPIGPHRIRILIYPESVYQHHAARITGIIRLHAVGRVICIPLVLERLVDELSDRDKASVASFVRDTLRQSLADKIPPQPPLRSRKVGRSAERALQGAQVLPDMLLIDPDGKDGRLWWYDEAGKVDSRDDDGDIQNGLRIFRTVCAAGKNAIWRDFTADKIKRIPIVADAEAATAELFFALGYYRRWLAWIEANATTVTSANVLKSWQDDEFAELDKFVAARVGADASGVRIIDVGCGFGRHLLYLASKHPSLTGLGIDVIPSMVGEASHDARKAGLEDRLYFCQDDATQLEAARDQEFDIAICLTNTLGNLAGDKASKAVGQLHRVVKPGGRVLVSVYSDGSIGSRLESYEKVGLHVRSFEKRRLIVAAEGLESSHFEHRQIANLFNSSGFSVVAVRQVGTIGLVLEATRN